MANLEIKRGDVVWVDLRGAEGAEKMGERPCIVVQNDGGNRGSPLTIVVPLTDAAAFKGYPQQVQIAREHLGPMGKDSVAECGHIRSIDRDARISRVISQLPTVMMQQIDGALKASLGLS